MGRDKEVTVMERVAMDNMNLDYSHGAAYLSTAKYIAAS